MMCNIQLTILLAFVCRSVYSGSIAHSQCLQTQVICIGLPEGCLRENDKCDTVLIVRPASDDRSALQFQLSGRSDITRHWFAIALLDHRLMANDSVTEIYSVYANNDSISEDLRQTWSLRRGSEVLDVNQVNGIKAEGKTHEEEGVVSAKWIRSAVTKVIHDSTAYALDIRSKIDIFLVNSGVRPILGIGGANGVNEVNDHSSHLATSVFLERLPSEPRVALFSSNKDALKDLYSKCKSSQVDHCLGLPDNCINSENCDLLLAITSNAISERTVSFQLIGTPQTNTGGWIAVGLSLDDSMGSDAVVECLSLKNGKNVLTNSWNEGHRNEPVGEVNGVVSDGPFVNADGLLNCKWKRSIKTEFKGHVVDLNSTQYFLLLAKGPIDDHGKKQRHSKTALSSSAIDLLSSHSTELPTSPTTVSSLSSTSSPSGIDQAYQRCKNSERLCFGFKSGVTNCIDDNGCQLLFSSASTSQSEGTVEIELFWLKASGSQSGWAAVGLSDDQAMGSDSVTQCVVNANGKTQIRSGINPSGHSPTQTVNNTSVEPLDHSIVDNLVYCKWRLSAVTNVTLDGQQFYFDVLNNSYYLLLAYGPLKSDGNLGRHSANSRAFSDKVDLQSVGIVTTGSNIYVQVHATLMIIAWLGCVSIAILLARHYKNSWPDSTLCGVKLWFAFHRLLMVFGVSLILISFVVILVNKKGWVGASAHPVVGLISIILSFLQPVGALFRPNPDSSVRWLFNWLHWSGGYLGHGLAVIAILLSTNFTSLIPECFFWILISFIIFYILSHISIGHLRTRHEQNGNIQDFKTNSDGSIDALVIVLIGLVISALVAAMAVLVFV